MNCVETRERQREAILQDILPALWIRITLMRARIRLLTLMRIRIQILASKKRLKLLKKC
jgi:hypothetical protein